MTIIIRLTEEQHLMLMKLLTGKIKELTRYNIACSQYARKEELAALESLAKIVAHPEHDETV